MKRDNVKLGLVLVDYLQLMPGPGGAENNEQAVAANARGLKKLSKELGCPVMLLSQLNRSVEQREDKRPRLSDLRESGAIEEAGDCVIGMYRDDYYNEESETPGVVELLILKQRNGPTGSVSVGFKAQSVSFENLREEFVDQSDRRFP
jgi:replicative DNA helicase